MVKILLSFLVLFIGSILSAESLKIAAGAGYKKPLIDVLKVYEQTHPKIDAMFGNMAQIFAHAKQGEVSLLIGDKKFLEKQKEVVFSSYQTIGYGKAVIAYAKGVKFSKVEDLQAPSMTKIALPDTTKAIYGIAGMEFLKNSQLYDVIKDKLLIVATVPQVITYVITHEVDAGIVNLTAALDAKDKIGGYLEIPAALYTPIEIVAGRLDTCSKNKECTDFVAFLNSNSAKEIFHRYGL
ncbi:MAG: molybdate ABC transporter substrate-binding protein [Sulfurospirillaceae bacterium]|nr:molybdate ABC transporter substrate-binding protein [Sulfurospirillaceae bacterium]MDD2826409.1 molybdate ABC transporter substrate-binding protein [Sulfurospirillaceae bacterium]